jgi:hypothetical protein
MTCDWQLLDQKEEFLIGTSILHQSSLWPHHDFCDVFVAKSLLTYLSLVVVRRVALTIARVMEAIRDAEL